MDPENVFQEQLKSFLLSPEDILGYLNQIDDTIKTKQELIDSLQAELKQTKNKMDKLIRLYLNSQISGEGFAQCKSPLEERKRQLERQIPELLGELDWLKSETRDLYSRWPKLERGDELAIIEQTVERITIGRDDIEIELAYLPASYKLLPKMPHNFTPACHLCDWTLRTQKPKQIGYPSALNLFRCPSRCPSFRSLF